MDRLMNNLKVLSKKYRRFKIEFFNHSNELINTFNLSEEQKKSVAFGIIKTGDPHFQNYLDILNSNKKLSQLSRKIIETKCDGINRILRFALKCNEDIQGYHIEKLLMDPINNRNELFNLFEGLTGVHHIHIINDKIMLEIPAREYVLSNKQLLRYVDYWNKILNDFRFLH
jgi:hypothetical protein